jgi:hypothetical protein
MSGDTTQHQNGHFREEMSYILSCRVLELRTANKTDSIRRDGKKVLSMVMLFTRIMDQPL